MDRTNESSTGYSYGGQTYKKESRTDSQGNTYTVDIPVSNVIPVSSITQPAVQIKTPQAPQPVNYTQQILDITSPYMEQSQMQNDLARQQTEMNDYQALSRTLAGKSAFEAEQNQALGLNAANEEYIRKSAELSALNKQAAVAQQENIAQGRQLGSVASFVAGQGSEIERNRAIRAMRIGAELDAIQGNIAVAQMKVKNAVDAKYAPIEQELQLRKQFFDMNDKLMQNRSQAEQKAWERAKYVVEKKEKEVEEQKKKEEAFDTMLIKARSQGAPVELVEKARQAKTPLDAAMILGQYSGDYWAIEKAKSESAKIRAEANAKAGTGGGVGTPGTYKAGSDPLAESWAKQIADKKAKLTDVPSALRSRVVMAMGASPEATAKADETKQRMVDILTRLQGYKGVATGPKAQMFPVASQVDLPIPFSGPNQTSDALADAEALSALLTTENIALMKGLGSMSNIEFSNIEKIGSSILGRDKDGNAYFKGTRANYDREIQRLLDDLNKLPSVSQNRSDAPQTQSKWTQGDVQNTPSPLSGMAQKNYLNPKAPFGTVDFNLPTKP